MWERFKILLKKCPGHKHLDMDQILYFTTELKTPTRMLLDASDGRTIKTKTTKEIKELIENIMFYTNIVVKAISSHCKGDN